VAAFRITIACDSDDELQVLPDEPLRLLYEVLAEAIEEGTALTDSIEPGGTKGYMTIELAGSDLQGAVEQLLARKCFGTDLTAEWFDIVPAHP
jgi:hypothetical protein